MSEYDDIAAKYDRDPLCKNYDFSVARRRCAELEAENARLRADIDYSSLDAAIVREERLEAELDALDVKYVTVQHELAALKPLARFQHGVTTCPSCHAIMRWEQGEVVEWTK